METTDQVIKRCIAGSGTRVELWIKFLQSVGVRRMVEVGVLKGDFAAKLLAECESIEKYYMLDPWRHLDEWNKPSNRKDWAFKRFLRETWSKTMFAASKRVILRGKTTEVVDQIADGELDFAYIDGDHTLRGITIDLIRLFPKVRQGGWIGGDDFNRSIWQHSAGFEPTLVFPFAVCFAEAVGAPVYGLPHNQFLIEKTGVPAYAFVDLAGHYDDLGLGKQFRRNRAPGADAPASGKDRKTLA